MIYLRIPKGSATDYGGYYVSPSGSSTASGDVNHPWDLQTALSGGYPAGTLTTAASGGSAVNVYLRSGLYSGLFTTSVTNCHGIIGSGVDNPGGKICFRSYPGEWAVVSAPNPNNDYSGTLILDILSDYLWFRDFEIEGRDTRRTTGQSGLPNDIPWSGAINTETGVGVGTKMIHLITHDTGGGPSLSNDSSNGEIYGCVNYNHGWIGGDRGHGHNTYSRNATGQKWLRNSINWGNCDISMQIYADTLVGITLENGIYYMGGGLGETNGYGYRANIQFGGGNPATNGVIHNNATYNPWGQSGQCYDFYGWDASGGIQPCTYTDNYIASGDIFAGQFKKTLYPGISDSNLTMTGNYVYGRYIDDNSSYGNPTIDDVTRFGNAAYNNTFFGTTEPTSNFTKVIPVDKFETGRGHVAVYNWQGFTTVSVNISSFMPNGSTWAAYHAQNPLGSAVATGTNYQGGTVTLPMTAGGGLTVAAPTGLNACPASFPEFAAFLIRKTS